LREVVEDRAQYERAESPCLLVVSDRQRVDETVAVIVLVHHDLDDLAGVLEHEHLAVDALGVLESTDGVTNEVLDVDLELAFRARAFELREFLPISTECWTKERHRLMGSAASPRVRRFAAPDRTAVRTLSRVSAVSAGRIVVEADVNANVSPRALMMRFTVDQRGSTPPRSIRDRSPWSIWARFARSSCVQPSSSRSWRI
jgi:hypothetical protein